VRHLVAGTFSAAAVVLLLAGSPEASFAQSSPTPTPTTPAASPAPSPSPAAKKFSLGINSSTTFTNQQFVGPGTSPVEGPGFALGSPISPGTPYDFFSRSPLVTGEAMHQTFIVKPTWALSSAVDFSFSAGYGTVGGSGNVASYWGSSIMPTLNPHLGMRAIAVPPAFPTHNGGDAVQGSRASILDGSVLLHNGNGGLSAGWIDPHQTVPFVFTPPAWTNTPAQLVPLLPENIGEKSPGADLAYTVPILPLQGVSAWAKVQNATVEVMDGELPSAFTSPARMSSVSAILKNGSQVTYSAEIANLTQAGPTLAPVLYGTNPTTTPSAQGLLPTSTLFGQRMTVGGIGAVFPAFDSDFDLRAAWSCYAVAGAAVATSSCTGGNYLYGKVHHGFSAFDLSAELFRFTAQYAPAILPYGMAENVWNIAYAPRSWFDNAYQFVDNSRFGANRQGVRLSSTFLLGPVEVRLAGGIYGQIAPYTAANAAQVGFVEPYFTPQLTAAGGTLGTERHLDASFAWHPQFADVRVDFSDMTTFRAASSAANSTESISMDYPGIVIAFSRPINAHLFGSLGGARFAVDGSYDNVGAKNAALVQNVLFFGLQIQQNATSMYHIQYRLYSVYGNATAFGGNSPAFSGPQLMFEQIFKT
jgi:hypothetical protein